MKTFGLILLALATACAVGAIEALLVMVLWNYVLCAIFTTIPTISYWLAWGVLFILNILRTRVKVSNK